MRQLLWKEWRELRFLPLGAAILSLLLEFGYYIMCRFDLAGMSDRYDWQNGERTLWMLWAFFAILAGSGLISQEVGNGTLSFLFALPTSRRKIWISKVATGFVAMLLCVAASTVVAVVFVIAGLNSSFATSGEPAYWQYILSDSLDALLCAVACFAVSIAVSPLLDRYISAASVSVATCLALAIGIGMGTASYYLPDTPASQELGARMAYAIAWIIIPAFAAISYWTFTHGETLRSRKRFFAAGRVSAVCFILFAVLYFLIRSNVQAQYNAQKAQLIAMRSGGGFGAPGVMYTPGTMSLNFASETDDMGHPRYVIQPLPVSAKGVITLEWTIDGKVGGSSRAEVMSNEPVTLGAWIDNNDETMIKSVLAAHSVAIENPEVATVGLHLVAGGGNTFAPITLHFKNGFGWSTSDGLDLQTGDNSTGHKMTIYDAVLVDSSYKGRAIDIAQVPNDASSKPFVTGEMHRVTVTAEYDWVKGSLATGGYGLPK